MAHSNGAAFGWHRLSLPQLAAVSAAPVLVARGIVSLSNLGVQAIGARVVHRLATDKALDRYASIANAPGFATALAHVLAELRLAKLDQDALDDLASELSSTATGW